MEFEKKFQKAKEFFLSKGFIIADDNLKAILAAKEKGIPVLAVGPTGSGKTLFWQLYAEFEGGKYYYQSLNGSITIHDLTQERIIGKDGTFQERDMILAQWLRSSQKQQSILQFDEINAAKPETVLALHPIMDLKGELILPYSDEVLKVDKSKAILVMSCNEGDEYAGINAMNIAFQNRYLKIHFPYLQGEALVSLLTLKTGRPREDCVKVVKTWEKYMTSRDPDQAVVSIRMLEYWLQLSEFMGLKTAGKYTMAGLIANDEDELNEIIEGDFFVNLPDEVENGKENKNIQKKIA